MVAQTRLLLCAVFAAWLAGSSLSAHAVSLDFLFGKKSDAADAADSKRRNWPIGQFTSVQLVAHEAGAADNQHPADWPADLLRKQLGPVRADVGGAPEPLFFAEELDELVGPLAQALALANPGDDVLLLSTHRRGRGVFAAPLGITARLFVLDGTLQLIVRDARLDFYNKYLGSHVEPTFTYGSRAQDGGAVLQSATAMSRRKDWLSMAAAVPAANVAPVAAVAPVPAVLPAPVSNPPAAAKPPRI